jgi:class 3 adenylate cyclase
MTRREVEVAFLLADLSGYTALTEVHGDTHAADALARYERLARAALQPSARLLERVGDEVLIVAPEVTSVVRTAVALRDAVDREPLFPTLRCGLHAGTAVENGTRYVGSTLNLTARVAAYARGGEILCTERVTALAPFPAGITYRQRGAVRFKNVQDPVALFEVLTEPERDRDIAIDPVCRMQVQRDVAPARLPYGDQTYYFCSFECARAFPEHPQDYR